MGDNAMMPLWLWRHLYAAEHTQNDRMEWKHYMWQIHYIILSEESKKL